MYVGVSSVGVFFVSVSSVSVFFVGVSSVGVFYVCECVLGGCILCGCVLGGCIHCGCVSHSPCATLQMLVKHNQLNTKMLSAVLTGVNRAFPYARGRTCSACTYHTS